MEKPAITDVAINTLIGRRWSPRAFDSKPIEESKIEQFLEAARWAFSAYNDQPWRFIVAAKGTELYNKMFESLGEFNQAWVKDAPLLLLSLYTTKFKHDGSDNGWALHDLGAANAQLVLEALSLNIFAHPMVGLDYDKLNSNLEIPDGVKAGVMFAMGYYGTPEQLSGFAKEREVGPRSRVPVSELILAKEL